MYRIRLILAVGAMSWGIVETAAASVRQGDIGEMFSNSEGTIQFIELFNPIANINEHEFKTRNARLILYGGTIKRFNFPSDPDSNVPTANTKSLLGEEETN